MRERRGTETEELLSATNLFPHKSPLLSRSWSLCHFVLVSQSTLKATERVLKPVICRHVSRLLFPLSRAPFSPHVTSEDLEIQRHVYLLTFGHHGYILLGTRASR